MTRVSDIEKKYIGRIDHLDLDLIISFAVKKPREFVLAHPEFKLNKNQELKILNCAARREKNKPLAYILGYKEFYGLNFKVTRDTLIPRPETELLVEEVLKSQPKNKTIIDIGTGSGNIIISLAKNIKGRNNFYAVDISEKALRIARYNSEKNKVKNKINFTKSNLLSCFIQNQSHRLPSKNLFIVANLPYLSKKIYSSAMANVKNYEPKSALYAPLEGLHYYEKLFKQIKNLQDASCEMQVILEISPEQKSKINRIILVFFPKTKVEFKKDLSGRWRIVYFKIQP
jgi:release factor glutamine methyltransferase